MRTIVRIKDEEHFVMFKMHYSDNWNRTDKYP
jgi:hypothetical protein